MKKYDEAIARLQEIEIVVRDGEIVNVHNLDDLPDSALAVLTKKGRWIVRAGGKLLIPLGAIAAASAANQGYAGEGRFKDGGAVGAYVEVTADLMCADLVESGVHGWVNSVKRVFSLGTGPSLTERRLREALDARPQQGGSRVNE